MNYIYIVLWWTIILQSIFLSKSKQTQHEDFEVCCFEMIILGKLGKPTLELINV